MALAHNSVIPTNGLIRAFDPINPKSYSGSGSSFIDMSSSKQNATLFNSPELYTFPINGKRNQLLWTEKFDESSYWSAGNITLEQINGSVWKLTDTTDANATQDHYLQRQGVILIQDVPFIYRVKVKADTASKVRISIRNLRTSNFVDVNLSDGSLINFHTTSANPNAYSNIKAVEDGFYQITFVAPDGNPTGTTNPTAFTRPAIIILDDSGNFEYQGSANKSILIKEPHYEYYTTNVDSPYQRINSAFDVFEEGKSHNKYFHFNGTNQYITIGDPADILGAGAINACISYWSKPYSIASSIITFGSYNNVTASGRIYIGVHNDFWDFGWNDQNWGSNIVGTRASGTTNWTHVVLNITNGNAVLYINGEETNRRETGTATPTETLAFGAYFFDGGYNVTYSNENASSNLFIWNRPLSESEIKSIYNTHKNRFIS